MRKAARRNQRGQGLIEGALGLIMVLGGAIIAVLLILNSGTGIFLKMKIGLVTAQAAQYAAVHQTDANVQGETQAFVEALMPNVGLTPKQLTVTVVQCVVNGAQGEQVTITNNFPIIGNASFPAQIQLSDTEFASTTISG